MRPVVSIRSVIILHMLFDIIINKMDGIELFYLVSLLYLIKTTLGGSPPLKFSQSETFSTPEIHTFEVSISVLYIYQ